MNHEQFALLQSPHTLDTRMFIKVGKECKLISKKKKNYVKQLEDAECVSLTLSWVPRQIGCEDSYAASCLCVNSAITCGASFHLSVVPSIYIWSGAVQSV